MKKSLALILELCIFLSACTAGNGPETIGDPTTTPPTSSQTTATTAPAETGGADETVDPSRPNGTQPSDTSEPTEATQPSVTVSSGKEESPQKPTALTENETPINTTWPTNPPDTKPEETEPYSTEASSTEPPATEPPATEPLVTEPPVTEPPATVPLETTIPPTEPPAVEEDPLPDCQEAMDVGNTHGAASYGWTVDPSLNEDNAGFHFGSWVFPQDGQKRLNAEAIGQVDFLYREMKRLYPDLDLSGIRFRVHAFVCADGTYEVRAYYS